MLRFRVGDNVVVVAESHTVQEALVAAAADRRAGAILLVDGQGRLTGIFTDGDLRRLVRTEGADGLQRPIVEVMTVNPRRLDAQSLVRDAVRLVRERRVDEIPVVDEGGAPVGIVDVQDLIAMKAVQE
ncbi:MAG: CBS domain-containing protein [Phycisphaeraceae bacterium]|nr:CBS domain-containing protein [Phycisphaeraceae bacterium]